MNTPEKWKPKARYFGPEASHLYTELNASAFDLPIAKMLAAPIDKPQRTPQQVDAQFYDKFANELGVDHMVKVVSLPICIPPDLSKGSIREMRELREKGALTALRGNRKTDLARPLKPEMRQMILDSCPNLVDLIQRVEAVIKGSDLFIRAIKMDEARASTTQKEEDRQKGNLHFDAEKDSLEAYKDPVYQFYANVGRLPRQFRIIPVPLPEILQQLVANGHLTEAESQKAPLKDVLHLYVKNFPIVYEQIIVESGQLAIFDGRTFAHDAGKGRMRSVRQGTFTPSHEPDLLLAFDTPKTGYHQGYYAPEQSFLEDPGTKAWWEIINKAIAMEQQKQPTQS